MKKISCGVISYLGEAEVREQRWDMQVKQLEWLKKIDIFESIDIIAMEWTEEEIKFAKDQDERIIIIEYSKMPQGIARNKLLERLYESDYDWELILDNDSVLYNRHMSGNNFFNEIVQSEELWQSAVDVIIPIEPRREPFTAEYKLNKDKVDHNFVFKLTPGMKTSFFIIRNFDKFHKVREYFDESFIMLEDYEKAVDFAFKGYGIYKCKNIVLKEYGTAVSTLPYENNGGRKIFNDKWNEIIYNKWSTKGMMKDGDKIKSGAFIKECFKKHKKKKDVIIPKEGVSFGLSGFL